MIYKKLAITMNPYQLYSLVSREYPESFLLESLDGADRLARFSFIGFDPKKHIRAKGNVVSVEGEQIDSKSPIRELDRQIPKIKVEK